jgi:hypothetical protein
VSKVYSADVLIYATVYIRADSPEEAKELYSKEFRGQALELLTDDYQISNRQFDDPNLPDISLSPAMTICEDELELTELEEVEHLPCEADEEISREIP